MSIGPPDGPTRGVEAALEALQAALQAAADAAGDLRAAVADRDGESVRETIAGVAARQGGETAGELLERVAAQMGVEVAALRATGRARLLTQQRRVAAAVLRMAGHTHAAVSDALHRDATRSSVWCAEVDADPELRDAALRLGLAMGVASEADAAAAERRQCARTRNRKRRRR